MKKTFKPILFILIIGIVVGVGYFWLLAGSEKPIPLGSDGKPILGLNKIYGQDIFASQLIKTIRVKPNPFVEPQMGWKTKGDKVFHPSNLALDGLRLVMNGRTEEAIEHAEILLQHGVTKDNALFFPFDFDFSPYWPYDLKAPWTSAFTQGLALGLYSYIYNDTKDPRYLDIANKVFNSFKVPIEKGGFTRFEAKGVFFEEYPTQTPIRVLNGAEAAMLAIYDYAVITDNPEALRMFRQSVQRLESLLPKYETSSQISGRMVTTYSLAPTRPEVLCRFVGTGNMILHKIRVFGHSAGQSKELSVADVGSDSDGDVMSYAYIWDDPQYMNWGERKNVGGMPGREVLGRNGQYNHSPFKVVLPDGYNQYELEMVYTPIEPGVIHLHAYDDFEQYWPVGQIIIGNDATGRTHTDRFSFSAKFINAWREKSSSKSKVDERYIDDNYNALAVIARLSGSKTLSKYVEKWKQTVDAVPSQWYNNVPESLIEKASRQPLPAANAADGFLRVEYPAAVAINDQIHLFYSYSSGNERRNIAVATSQDGISWQRRDIFDLQALPEGWRGGISRPSVIKLKEPADSGKRYMMYMTVYAGDQDKVGRIGWASSPDGEKWNIGGIINASPAFCTRAVKLNDGKLALFSITPDGAIRKALSADGVNWTSAGTIYQNVDKYRKLDGLSILVRDEATYLLLETTISDSKRHDILLFREGPDGRLKANLRNPVIVDPDWLNVWDAVSYGYDFSDDFVYYSGFNPADGTAKIGRGKLKTQLFDRYIEVGFEP